MITVFLTDEAQDALIEEFEENGFPELCSDEWTKDILIEPIEACMTIRCQKDGEEELYQKAERFFPPKVNMRESETITFTERELDEIHDQVEDFLSGEAEVPGIPTDEEHSWLRNSVLFRRLVIPYIQKHLVDGSFQEHREDSGIYIYCEENEIRTQSVAGDERPELVYVRLTEEGVLVEEPGRYYDDELQAGEKLKSAIRELDNRPQYLDIEGDGAQTEWPPMLLEEYQCGRLVMDGRLRRSELGDQVVPVSFKRKDFLWQHPSKASTETIYLTADTMMKLPEVEVPLKRIPAELLPETKVEIIDAAFTCIVEIDGANLRNTKLSLYNRFGLPLLSPVRAEAAGVCKGARSFLEDGNFASDGEGYLGDVAFSLLFGYKKILSVLIVSDWFGKHGRTENDQSGILISADDENIVIQRVEGSQRPVLVCSAPEGERVFFRPYQKDDPCDRVDALEIISTEAFRIMNRSPEEVLKEKLQTSDDSNALEKESLQGNPYAMKLLAKQLLQGEPSTEDKKLALSWYEKAAEQLPEDDDLEFEIFMLKMEINN